jgi:BirA family biotin operon repressor/biotin-[acetyl-CoA-carboxylase] ligase
MTSSRGIASLFGDLPEISTVEHYASLGSTNDRARELAAQGAPEIALVAADEQLAGRGRQGRSWHTPPGTALAFSLLVRPAIAARHAMRLTMLAGLAAVEGIEQATGLRLDLKWPNDIVTLNYDQSYPSALSPQPSALSPQPFKVGGILTECAFQGDDIAYAVIGLGLNVNVDFSQHSELREIAASLMHLAGREVDRQAVLKAVVAAFVDGYAGIAAADRVREAWAARLINLRQPIRVSLSDRFVEGYAEGVADDGALLLRTADDQVQRLLSGDVTLHDLNR